MATLFHLSILTPEQAVFDGDVEYVEAPGSEGYFGVLAHHAAMVTALSSGTLKVRHTDGKEERFQVPVEIPAGTELGALGAAIAAAVASGVHADYGVAVKTMTRIARRCDPDPSRGDHYARRYARYSEIITALGPWWNR